MVHRQGQLEKKLVELEAQQQQLIEKNNRTSKNYQFPRPQIRPARQLAKVKEKAGKNGEDNQVIRVIVVTCT